jgi:hypothetical protein
VMNTASATTVNGTPATVLTFNDGTTMTLVGFNSNQIQTDFFKT